MNEQTTGPTKARDLTPGTLFSQILETLGATPRREGFRTIVRSCIKLKLLSLGANRVSNLDPSKYAEFSEFMDGAHISALSDDIDWFYDNM